MLYLILHKVRGEPAFDIAQKLEELPENWGGAREVWIIPTSGHRAYPYKWWNLEDLADISAHDYDLPENWPDHYQTQAELQRHPKISIEDLLI